MLVGRNEKTNLATRQRVRVPIEPKLSKVLEKQSGDDIDPEVVGTADASSRNLPVLNAGKQSAKIISNLNIGVGDDFPDPKGNDTIYALDAPVGGESDTPTPVFPPARVLHWNGERADYLSESSRAVGGEVRLNGRHHTAGLKLFAGSRALRTHACKPLLDTGSPASFIQKEVWLRMLACGAASEDGLTKVAQKLGEVSMVCIWSPPVICGRIFT